MQGTQKDPPYEPSEQEEDEEEDLAELELEEDAAAEAEAAAQDDNSAAEFAKKRRRHSNRVRAVLTALTQSSYDALKYYGQPVMAERRKLLWCRAEHAERHELIPWPLELTGGTCALHLFCNSCGAH